jgi:hypothetical protein
MAASEMFARLNKKTRATGRASAIFFREMLGSTKVNGQSDYPPGERTFVPYPAQKSVRRTGVFRM